MTTSGKRLLLVAAPTLFLACSDDRQSEPVDAGLPDSPGSTIDDALPFAEAGVTEAGTVATGPTYWRDIVPIAENKCMGCHQPGGIGPFSMASYAEAKARAPLIAHAVAAGTMPPYYIEHDGSCGSFADSPALTPAEKQTIVAWAAGDAAEGTPGQVVMPQVPHLTDGVEYHTPLFAPVAQGTDVALFDEYRCFLIEPGLVEDAFVTGFEVVPGNSTLVHHIIGFAVDPSAPGDTGEPNATIMQRLHDVSPGREGWPCFGRAGDGVSVAGVPVEWAPGQGVVSYPAGMGFAMKPGYRFVVQVHYNLADPLSVGQVDTSILRVRYAKAVERKVVFFLPDGFLDTLRAGSPHTLPPGHPAAIYRWRKTAAELGLPPSLPFVDVVAVGPHMHTRGIGQQLDIGTQGGAATCASRLARWDFHWQKFYFYQPGAYPRLTQSSYLDVTCTYDTRAESTPVLPGWGTRNEMCLTVLMAALPPGA